VTEMPSALHQLVGTVTDTYAVVAEHPGPGGMRPSVWEVCASGRQRWFVKQHAGPRLHRREVDAYQKWTIALGPGRTPDLVAAEAATQTILVTAVPGHSLNSLRLPADQERKAYEQAGELLARHHSAAGGGPTADTAEGAWEETVSKVLASAAAYVPEPELSTARALLSQPPPRLPQVAGHGDYMPKNWMWDESEQLLRVIDFERAELQPAPRRDLSRLRYRILLHHPELNAAFHNGYGRTLTEDEVVACRAYGALDAVDALAWGLRHHDIGLVDEAHTMLDNLRLESRNRLWGGWAS